LSRDLEEKARRMCEDWPGLGDRIGRVEENLAAELIREDSDSEEGSWSSTLISWLSGLSGGVE